jgi:hypothetical protein
MGRLRFSRLRDLWEAVAGQDGEETCHSASKALRAAAGKSSYRLGLEQHCPLPISSVEKPAATRMLDIERDRQDDGHRLPILTAIIVAAAQCQLVEDQDD